MTNVLDGLKRGQHILQLQTQAQFSQAEHFWKSHLCQWERFQHMLNFHNEMCLHSTSGVVLQSTHQKLTRDHFSFRALFGCGLQFVAPENGSRKGQLASRPTACVWSTFRLVSPPVQGSVSLWLLPHGSYSAFPLSDESGIKWWFLQ